MPMLDVFTSDAFSVQSLTDAVNKIKFVPSLIGGKGLFTETGVSTTAISIEEKNGVLALVSPSPRGGPGQTLTKDRRKLRMLAVPHFQLDDAVFAEEVQNVRPFGQEDGLDTVMRLVTERLQYASQSFEATLEYARVGAVKGIVRYADSSELNLFTEFGVTQEAEINFNLTAATPVAGVLRKACNTLVRTVADNMEGAPFSSLYAVCGDDFFDALVQHAEVRNTYLNWQAAAELRSSYVSASGAGWGLFEFGGIAWENYRGKVGDQSFVDSSKCHIVPLSPGLFKTVYAPADYMETVNTIGRRVYTKQFLMQNDKGVNLESQMNALCYCTRPKALMHGRMS